MSGEIWEPNSNYQECNAPEVGDIVYLKRRLVLIHRIKITVSSVTDEHVIGRVEAAFDWDNHAQIINGEVTSLVGTELQFKHNMIHEIIKNPASKT